MHVWPKQWLAVDDVSIRDPSRAGRTGQNLNEAPSTDCTQKPAPHPTALNITINETEDPAFRNPQQLYQTSA